MNPLYVHMYPLPLKPASHPPSHSHSPLAERELNSPGTAVSLSLFTHHTRERLCPRCSPSVPPSPSPVSAAPLSASASLFLEVGFCFQTLEIGLSVPFF